MYNIDFVFMLDIADKSMKEFMESCNMPYPVLQNCLKQTVTMKTSEIPTKKQQEVFIASCMDVLKNADYGKFVCTGIHFKGTENVYRLEDETDKNVE